MSANEPSQVPIELAAMWEDSRSRLRAMVARRLDPVLLARVDADDVLSDAFLDAVRRWRQFSLDQWPSPHVWMYGIVRDRLIETWRFHTRANRDPRRAMPWPDQSSLQLGLSIVDPGTSPQDAIRDVERRERVLAALEQLPDVDRELLSMRFFDGLSFAEAAQLLGITENNANVRHLRALQKLRDIWVAAHGEWSRP